MLEGKPACVLHLEVAREDPSLIFRCLSSFIFSLLSLRFRQTVRKPHRRPGRCLPPLPFHRFGAGVLCLLLPLFLRVLLLQRCQQVAFSGDPACLDTPQGRPLSSSSLARGYCAQQLARERLHQESWSHGRHGTTSRSLPVAHRERPSRGFVPAAPV